MSQEQETPNQEAQVTREIARLCSDESHSMPVLPPDMEQASTDICEEFDRFLTQIDRV